MKKALGFFCVVFLGLLLFFEPTNSAAENTSPFFSEARSYRVIVYLPGMVWEGFSLTVNKENEHVKSFRGKHLKISMPPGVLPDSSSQEAILSENQQCVFIPKALTFLVKKPGTFAKKLDTISVDTVLVIFSR